VGERIAKARRLLGVQGAKPLGLALLLALPAQARTLQVGPGREFAAPSAAARVAQDGDTVSIAPGAYYDCAIWNAGRLTIVGEGEATLTDTACAGKAAFVIAGDGVTVRNLGFARIRVADDDGAGIRASGRDLTVEDSRFVNDQVGILAAAPGGFLRVAGCTFSETGSSATGRRNDAVRASGYALLRIERSTFAKARGGADVSAEVGRTELAGNRLLDEGGHMAGPMVLVQGGALLLEGNTVELAAGAAARPGVVLAVGDAAAIAVRGNTLRGDGAAGTPLLRNWTGQAPAVGANTLPPGTAAVSDAGLTWHRMRATAAQWRDAVHALYRQARHLAAELAHRFG
jgi:hypothetical protein